MTEEEPTQGLNPQITSGTFLDSPASRAAPELVDLLKVAVKEGVWQTTYPDWQEIMYQYVGLGMTMEEIGLKRDLTKQRISKLIKEIPKKLYHKMLRTSYEQRGESKDAIGTWLRYIDRPGQQARRRKV